MIGCEERGEWIRTFFYHLTSVHVQTSFFSLGTRWRKKISWFVQSGKLSAARGELVVFLVSQYLVVRTHGVT